MEEIDGLSKWRQHELAALTSEVQAAIERNQNPADCSKAKKLVCHMNHHDCGLGCLLHHTAYCLLAALATDRVLILSDLPWVYSNISIKDLFTPISETCLDYEGTLKKMPIQEFCLGYISATEYTIFKIPVSSPSPFNRV